MNSRRCIAFPKLKSQHRIGSNEYFDRAESGIKTIAAVHSQCRRWVISVEGSRGRASMHFRCSPKS